MPPFSLMGSSKERSIDWESLDQAFAESDKASFEVFLDLDAIKSILALHQSGEKTTDFSRR